MTDVTVYGLKELDTALKQFSAKVEAKILRGGLRAGAKVIQKLAQEKCPVDSGNLRKTIRVSTSGRRGEMKAKISAGGKNGVIYAGMVEFGTATFYTGKGKSKRRAYQIKPLTKKALAIDGGAFASAEHPGIKPQPFMRPALDEGAEKAVQKMAEYIRQRIEKEAK